MNIYEITELFINILIITISLTLTLGVIVFSLHYFFYKVFPQILSSILNYFNKVEEIDKLKL